MLLPLFALEDYINIKLSPEKLAEKLLLSGTKVEEIRKVKGETIFNLEITPNRADTLSFYGIAREIAVILNLELKEPETDLLINITTPNKKIDFKVLEKKLCPFYSLVKLKNITIKNSPNYLHETLVLSGIRPLNNVIDITNLVMLELGAPMHAFDASKIKGVLTLRSSKKSEKIMTLDSVERELPEGSIIIEDDEKLIDLAGLMGGKNSEIDQNTSEIILLVPFYNADAIRRTSVFTGLRSEASNRFEKNLDPNLHPLALNRAIKLLVENANARFGSSITSVGFPQELRTLNFELSLVKNILGIDLTKEDVINLLSSLGFMVNPQPFEENKLTIRIPSFRPDVNFPEDILEEIGRLYGYNNFPKTLPSGEIPIQKEIFVPDKERRAREYLINNGFFETTGYSLVSQADLKNIDYTIADTARVLHPTSLDFVYLRPSLLINLLKAFAANKARNNLAFFELAKEFKKEIDTNTTLPYQKTALVFGSSQTFGDLKAVTEGLLSGYNLQFETLAIGQDNLWEFGAQYRHQKQIIAQVGYLRKQILRNFDLENNPAVAWVNFELLTQAEIKRDYRPEPKFPSIIEDISFFVKEDNLGGEILGFIKNFDKLISKVEVLDVFQRNGQKSLTIRLEFNDPKKTLTNKEVNKLRLRLEQALVKKFKIVIRKD